MGDNGEEREREWGVVGKKGERVGDCGEERGEWGIVGKKGERVVHVHSRKTQYPH